MCILGSFNNLAISNNFPGFFILFESNLLFVDIAFHAFSRGNSSDIFSANFLSSSSSSSLVLKPIPFKCFEKALSNSSLEIYGSLEVDFCSCCCCCSSSSCSSSLFCRSNSSSSFCRSSSEFNFSSSAFNFSSSGFNFSSSAFNSSSSSSSGFNFSSFAFNSSSFVFNSSCFVFNSF